MECVSGMMECFGKVKIEDIPPSVNHYWASKGNRRFITKRGREFKSLLSSTAFGMKKAGGNVFLDIEVILPDKRRRDVDNFLKPILDALSGVAYDDDVQVKELSIKKTYIKGIRRTIVEVWGCYD